MKNRKNIRLQNYDYSQPGYYFVTICTKDREHLFGDIINGEMSLNKYCEILKYTWFDLPNHNSNIELDYYQIMPNHIHCIIKIVGDGSQPSQISRAGYEPAPTGDSVKKYGLPEIVRQLKSFSSKRINKIRNTPGEPVWQRNYYEHIIRNEKELYEIRKYIQLNPMNWEFDEDNYINIKVKNEKGI